MCASKTLALGLMVWATLAAGPAGAADKKGDANKEQIRRLQQAQQKLQQEKSQLAEEKAAAEGELEKARKRAEGEAGRATGLSRELAAARQSREALAVKLAETEAELRKAQELQRGCEQEGRRLQGSLTQERQRLTACQASNGELYRVGGEILERYQRKSCTDSLLQAEPFTGLKRVEIENMVEDFQEKLDGARLPSEANGASGSNSRVRP